MRPYSSHSPNVVTVYLYLVTYFLFDQHEQSVCVARRQERMDPLMGSVTDFIISESTQDHQAHVVHLPDGGHVLYVDGYLIPEHAG